jgi:putative flippase GtrA
MNIRDLSLLIRSWAFVKFILSGGITALLDLLMLSVFREQLQWPYWLSINVAFIIAVLVNFSLQRFWAFAERDLHATHVQFVRFFLVALWNLAMNNFIMFVLTTVFGLWYLGAQALTIGLLAIVNFVLYRYFVFK